MIPALKGVYLVISGGVAATHNTYPVYASDADGKPVPLVTGHFGNRYVGEINFSIDNNTGLVTSVDSTRMVRISGAAADADKVMSDATLNSSVVIPVSNSITVLNAQIIRTTSIKLNGPARLLLCDHRLHGQRWRRLPVCGQWRGLREQHRHHHLPGSAGQLHQGSKGRGRSAAGQEPGLYHLDVPRKLQVLTESSAAIAHFTVRRCSGAIDS